MYMYIYIYMCHLFLGQSHSGARRLQRPQAGRYRRDAAQPHRRAGGVRAGEACGTVGLGCKIRGGGSALPVD